MFTSICLHIYLLKPYILLCEVLNVTILKSRTTNLLRTESKKDCYSTRAKANTFLTKYRYTDIWMFVKPVYSANFWKGLFIHLIQQQLRTIFKPGTDFTYVNHVSFIIRYFKLHTNPNVLDSWDFQTLEWRTTI